jgi:spermidine dehydrogenase
MGIETARFHTAFDAGLYGRLGLTTGIFFDRETFGADRLLAGLGRRPWPELLAEAPLSDIVRRDLVRLYSESVDYLGGRGSDEKRALLRRTSYADFLTGFARVAPAALPFFQTRTHDLFGVGIDAVSAYTCFHLRDDYGGVDYPGARGLGLPELLNAGEHDEPYIFHFPDGNASLARLLVGRLLPHALPATGMDDVVTARARYDRLDEAGAPVRLRLGSTVVRVRHEGASSGTDAPPRGDVEVAYLRAGRLQAVRAGQAVLACWNGMIPHLCPDLPAPQKEALAYGVKVPLVYSQVQIRNWTAFARLGVHQVAAPGSYHPWVALDFPVSLGDYRFPARPEEPAVVFMMRTPCKPGRPAREQHRLGRFELMATPFATFEKKIREQLGRMLGQGGFDPDRDVEALTVNRWSHGYAYEYNSLFDPEWPPGQAPHERGRLRFGRVAIANADAAARAYTDAAIDEAWRAVRELRA